MLLLVHMYFLIALGNPGERYVHTPHNAGWLIVDKIVPADEWQENKYAKSSMAVVSFEGNDLMLVKPQTNMNLSGEVLPYLVREYGLTSETTIVIYDDIDIPVGKYKMSHDRGDGGHNGIKSIVEHLGTTEFTRIRIGVSEDLGGGKVNKPPVLKQMDKEWLDQLYAGVLKLKKALTVFMVQGREKSMAFLNTQ